MDRRENDVQTALRMQKLEIRMEAMERNLTENTASTKELLAAWNTSTGTLRFVKTAVLLAGGVTGTWIAVQKLWGH